MATQTANNGVAKTCESCHVTVTQTAGTRRTICPSCGHFYNSETASSRQSDRPRPQSDTPENEKDRSGHRLHSIASFFQNLGPRKGKSGEKDGSKNMQQKSQNSASGRHSGRHRRRPRSGTEGRRSRQGQGRPHSATQLPPIANDPRGKLTVQSPTSSTGRIADSPNPSERPSPRGSPSGTPTGLNSSKGQLSLTRDSSYGGSSSRNNSRHSHRRPTSRIDGSGNHESGYGSSPSERSDQVIPNSRPIKMWTLERLQEEVQSANASETYKEVLDFYASTFDSFVALNTIFKDTSEKDNKSSSEDSGLDLAMINAVYDTLIDMPQEIQKIVLKAIINSLLKDKKPHTKDDIRAFLVLLQNPQFNNMATYVIFAHLLRQVASLPDHDHHYLVHWLKRLNAVRFRRLVQKLHNFVACRLFPPKPQDLPPMSKCTWWIPSATKVLALLNAANNLSKTLVVPYTEFYNSALDHLDLMAEYYTWQNPSTHPGFSFCQYPFILSIAAKRNILQKDSEQQMIIMARRSLVAKVQRRQLPDIGMLFLNLTVRRSHLVSDSLNEIARKQHDLKKKLKVTFAGEPGLDMGGLTKEWFILLIRQIFQQDYGMFTYDKKAGVFWFSSAPCESYQEFNLVGVLMGLAVYNSIILDIRFPPCCYKKLLSPAVVPYNNPKATVGAFGFGLDDLAKVFPDIAHGLKELLEYEGDVEDDFGLTFQISYTEFGATRTKILKQGGDNISITNKNREEYVRMYVDFMLNKNIYQPFQAFYHGFHSVCASNALIMLRPEEVETLVCGSPNLNMAELKKVTVYDNYTSQDQTIKFFWEIVLNMPLQLQKQVLLFTTGSDRIPIGGMSEMQFKITRVNNTEMLPMAHTCFNQLVLPAYKSKKILKSKVLIAIQNAQGFGLE